MRKPIPFSPEDLQYLRDNWGKTPMSVMSAHLDRIPNVIYRKAQKVGIYTPQSPNFLTDQAKSEIIRLFKSGMNDRQICQKLGYCRATVIKYRTSQGYYRGVSESAPKIAPGMKNSRARLLYGAWK